jgi:small subunit ribosomal protein S20
LTAVQAKDIDAAKKEFAAVVASLDRAGTKRILHPNTVARRKSGMATKLNGLLAAGKQ